MIQYLHNPQVYKYYFWNVLKAFGASVIGYSIKWISESIYWRLIIEECSKCTPNAEISFSLINVLTIMAGFFMVPAINYLVESTDNLS
jgi:hypothetical protein